MDLPTARLSPPRFGSGFTFVMATGIVSLGARVLDVAGVDVVLFALNVAAFAALCLLTVLELVRSPPALAQELTDHRRGVRFLAIVAATCVVGAQVLVIGGSVPLATALLVAGALLWLILLYAIVTAVTINPRKPPLAEGIDGGWLLAVVATQSIAVLVALLSVHWHSQLRFDAGFVALSLWLWGGMLYAWIASLIVLRFAFHHLTPRDVTPSYWINMGAMAISVLAGSLLIADAAGEPLLHSLGPFLEGLTVLYWATGTWWIPLLAILTAWRHTRGRVRLAYDPLWWSAVFPLGMYAVATHQMAAALSLGFLGVITHAFFWLALAAWLLTSVAMVRARVA